MGLFYQKKNNFDEEDGRTAQFSDYFTVPPTAEGSDLDLIKEKDNDKPKEMEEKVNKGRQEQK